MRERGLNRADAKRAAKQAIEEMRKLAAIRMGTAENSRPLTIMGPYAVVIVGAPTADLQASIKMQRFTD